MYVDSRSDDSERYCIDPGVCMVIILYIGGIFANDVTDYREWARAGFSNMLL